MPRRIIYSGHVDLVTDDLDKAARQLTQLATQFNAYIGDASRTGSRGEAREATWTLRVPSVHFEDFLAAVRSIGELQSVTQKAEDVSEEYYDADARLRNKRLEEDQLLNLLKRDSGRLQDVLTVEKELSRVREEAERIEGRLKFLANQSDLSTVTVSVREVKGYVPEGPPTFGAQVTRSFGGSIDAMKSVGVAGVLFLAALLPWAGLVAVVGAVGLGIHRRFRRPTSPPPAAA